MRPSSPFEIVTCGADWVVLCYGLNQPPGTLVLEPHGRGSGTGHGQPLLVPGLALSGKSYKVFCGRLPVVLARKS